MSMNLVNKIHFEDEIYDNKNNATFWPHFLLEMSKFNNVLSIFAASNVQFGLYFTPLVYFILGPTGANTY
jgi:hypothetical protein